MTDQTTPEQPPTMIPMENEYVFPAYWGGATRSKTVPQIHSKLRDLRLAVGGIAAKKQAGGPMFPVKSAKDLSAKLAQALCDLDLVAPVIAQEVTLVDTANIPGNATSSGKPVFRTLAHVKATVRIGAADGSYVDMVGSGHGGDTDDKAGGKATTYAWKDAILKGLTTPEQNMIDTDDEAPSEGAGPVKADKAEKPAKPEGSAESQLSKVIDLIAAAKTDGDLDAIQADIKSGKLALAGADRLRASTVFVQRKEQIKAAAKETK